MDFHKLTREQLLLLFKQNQGDPQASEILKAALDNPFEIQVYNLDLSTAQAENVGSNGRHINFPFKSMIAISATDTSATINVKFNSEQGGTSKVPFIWNQSIKSDRMFSGAFLDWAAQPGKTMTLVVAVSSDITSGQLVNSGTVRQSPDSTFPTPTKITLAATTTTLLAAANSSTQTVVIENRSGADLYLGGSNVTGTDPTQGLILMDGNSYEVKTNAAIYGYSTAGGDVKVQVRSA